MTTIKQNAKEYKPKTTHTLNELEKVSVDLNVQHKEVLDDDGKTIKFEYNYVVVDGVEYRVGDSVLKQLKGILNEKPELKFFKVLKTGEGLKTDYQVLPIE